MALVGRWRFDEGAGTIALDTAGSNPGTINGHPRYVRGYSGYALELNGITDFVSCGDVLDMGTSSFSFGTWIKSSVYSGSGEGIIIGKKQDGSSNTAGWHLAFDWRNSLLQARIADGTTLVAVNIALIPIANAEWRHIFVVVDRSAINTIFLYVDGILRKSESISAVSGSADNSQPLCFGSNGSTPGLPFFNGIIDDVRVYNHALFASNIAELTVVGKNVYISFRKVS